MLRFNINTKPLKSFTLGPVTIDSPRLSKLVLPQWYHHVELGEYSYMNDAAEVRCYRAPQKVVIGKYSSIGECRFIIDGDHNVNYASTFPFKELGLCETAPENKTHASKTPILIGNDVWICDGAVIIGSGIRISDGAVVAAHSIVTRDVPPYAVVAGNPARIVKYRFSDDTISRLLHTRWWDLPNDVVSRELAPLISDVQAFTNRAETLRLERD